MRDMSQSAMLLSDQTPLSMRSEANRNDRWRLLQLWKGLVVPLVWKVSRALDWSRSYVTREEREIQDTKEAQEPRKSELEVRLDWVEGCWGDTVDNAWLPLYQNEHMLKPSK